MPWGTKKEWSDHWRDKIQGDLNQGLGSAGPGGSVFALENGAEVTENGLTLMQHNYGKASVGNNINFTVDTPCGVRSVTKSMTTSLALIAENWSQWGWLPPKNYGYGVVENHNGGVIDKAIGEFGVIDSNIHRENDKYFPGGRTPNIIHKNCTLRQLAAHQTRITAIPGVYTPEWPNSVDREILKRLMESIGNIDDLVAQTGAVQQGMDETTYAEVTDPTHPDFGLKPWSDYPPSDYRRTYTDKAHWITGAILEQLFGMTLYELLESQFDQMGLNHAYPSYDGNLIHDKFTNGIAFKGHFANPIEIPGLAVAYNSYRGPNGDELYLEPEQATESGYGIGSVVMSCRDLAKWAHEIRWGNSVFGLSSGMQQEMFSVQTNSDSPSIIDPDKTGDYVYRYNNGNPKPVGPNDWRGVNWGFGPQKMDSVQTGSGATVEVWGNIGQGGFGGYGGCVVWIEHNGTKLVVAANSNTGVFVRDALHAARDYAGSFL